MADPLSDSYRPTPDHDRSRYQAMLAPRKSRRRVPVNNRPDRHPGPGHYVLTGEQAHEAAQLADRIGVIRTAQRYDVSTETLARAWRRHGCQRRHTITRQRWYRAKVQGMAKYLAAHGPDATAEHYGISRGSIYRQLTRYGIPPPVGKGGPGRPRPRR